MQRGSLQTHEETSGSRRHLKQGKGKGLSGEAGEPGAVREGLAEKVASEKILPRPCWVCLLKEQHSDVPAFTSDTPSLLAPSTSIENSPAEKTLGKSPPQAPGVVMEDAWPAGEKWSCSGAPGGHGRAGWSGILMKEGHVAKREEENCVKKPFRERVSCPWRY